MHDENPCSPSAVPKKRQNVNPEVGNIDILLSLERLYGEVSALRTLMEGHIHTTNMIHKDHESRLRQVERAVQSGRGVMVFLAAAVALLGALGAWINISPHA